MAVRQEHFASSGVLPPRSVQFIECPAVEGAVLAPAEPVRLEFFVAGLASCVTFGAFGFASRHQFSAAGLEVAMNVKLGGRPVRVSRIEIVVTPPAVLATGRRDAFLAAALP